MSEVSAAKPEMTPERWQQLRDLLATAIDLRIEERAAYVDRVCQADVGLREELESLIAAHEIAEVRRFEQPALSATCEIFHSGAEPPENLCGRLIGAYRIEAEIARGGMGTVYRAFRADDQYCKQVAIKLVRAGQGSDFIHRFKNERQILASLDHPNIGRLLDGGTTNNGVPYFVMELIEGEPIDRYSDLHKLAISDRLRLFLQVCSAVQYAHQRSIIHRDIKPSNILVTPEGMPKLLDFGVAKMLDPAAIEGNIEATFTLFRLLTPGYASPEQVKGESITTASDVYSLGVVLYELLTCHSPYRLSSHTPHEVAQAVCEMEPEKPSVAVRRTKIAAVTNDANQITAKALSTSCDDSVGKLSKRLSGDLDTIALMALRKEPQRRYASVEQFAEDIHRHLANLPVIARRDAVGYRMSKFIARHKAGIAAAAVMMIFMAALVVLLAGGFYVAPHRLLPGHGPAGKVMLIVLPFENLSGSSEEDYFSDGLTEEMITQLGGLDPAHLGVIARTSAMQYKHTNKSASQIGRELAVDYILEGTVRQEGQQVRVTAQLIEVSDQTEVWAQSYDRDGRAILALQGDVAAAIARQIRFKLTAVTRAHLARSRLVVPEAHEAYLKGLYFWNKFSVPGLKRSMEYFQRAIDKDPSYAEAYAGLSASYGVLGVFGVLPPREAWPGAKAAAKKALEIDETLSEAHSQMGFSRFNYDRDWDQAEREFRRAIELNPSNANAHEGLAELFAALGRLDEGRREINTARDLDPLSRIINVQVAYVLFLNRQYSPAIEQLRMTQEMDPNFPPIYWALQEIYQAKGMQEEAYQVQIKVLTLMEVSPDFVAALKNAHSQGGWRGAWQKQIDMGLDAYRMAEAYTLLGDKDQAFDWLLKAADERFNQIVFAKVDPRFDALHPDPRFQDLLRRIGLPQ